MFFDGKIKQSRIVSAGGSKREASTQELLEASRQQRKLREEERRKNAAVLKIQTPLRRFLQMTSQRKVFRAEFDKDILKISKIVQLFEQRGSKFNVPLPSILTLLSHINFVYSPHEDQERIKSVALLVYNSLSCTVLDANCLNALHAANAEAKYFSWENSLSRFLCITTESIVSTCLQICLSPQENTATRIQLPMEGSFVALICNIFSIIFFDSMSNFNDKDHVARLVKKVSPIVSQSLSLLNMLIDPTSSLTRLLKPRESCESMMGSLPGEFVAAVSTFCNLLTRIMLLPVEFEVPARINNNSCSSTQQQQQGVWLRELSNLISGVGSSTSPIMAPVIAGLSASDYLGWRWLLRYQFTGASGRCPIYTQLQQRLLSHLKHFMTAHQPVNRLHRPMRGEYSKLTVYARCCKCCLLTTTSNKSHLSPTGLKFILDQMINKPGATSEDLIDNVFSGILGVLRQYPVIAATNILETGCMPVNPASAVLASDASLNEAIEISDHLSGMQKLEGDITSCQLALISHDMAGTATSIDIDDIDNFRTLLLVMCDASFLPVLMMQDTTNSSPLQSMLHVMNLCSLYCNILFGSVSVLSSRKSTSGTNSHSIATFDPLPVTDSLLNAIAFGHTKSLQSGQSTKITIKLWQFLNRFGPEILQQAIHLVDELNCSILVSFDRQDHAHSHASSSFSAAATVVYPSSIEQAAASCGNISPETFCRLLTRMFLLFCSSFSHQLAATDDSEFFDENELLPIFELQNLIEMLRKCLHRMFLLRPIEKREVSSHSAITPSKKDSRSLSARLERAQQIFICTTLYNSLFSRYERRAFMPPENWQWNVPSLIPERLDETQLGHVDNVSSLYAEYADALECVPQVFQFEKRLQLFQLLLRLDARNYQPSMEQMVVGGMWGVQTKIRRDQIVQDAFEKLHEIEPRRLKGRIQVEFISEQGYQEAGIDGGGLFKAFLDSFMKAAFDPVHGLFVPTTDQLLTPNPASALVLENHLQYMHFFGKMLGIAIYNRILVEPQFAAPFLNILLGRVNTFDDLWSLDKDLFRSMLSLKTMKKSIAQPSSTTDAIGDMGLYFVADRVHLDVRSTEELIPGGTTTLVTASNVLNFVHRFANYKLNLEAAPQCRAFLAGFRSIIPGPWTHMFSPREMQLLISGDDQQTINIADFRKNVHYAGGYHDSQPYIQGFWNILASLTAKQQGLFLKFVTSCSRPPLLGFGQLVPKFGIQEVRAIQSEGDAPRLPSAATCMNLLKLPRYESVAMLREKLLYAITSNSGFELS